MTMGEGKEPEETARKQRKPRTPRPAPVGPDAIERLRRDLKAAAERLTPREARFMVDAYYTMQEQRIRAANQVRAMLSYAQQEPHEILTWYLRQSEALEGEVAGALASYSQGKVMGRWAESIVGIGPILSAGLLAHIDITRAPTVGHIWRFAGLDPTTEWLGTERATAIMAEFGQQWGRRPVDSDMVREVAVSVGRNPEGLIRLAQDRETGRTTRDSLTKALARRPWNASLKLLTWKIGQSFVRVHNNERDIYGHLLMAYKSREQAKNDALDFQAQAAAILTKKRIGHDTDAYKAYAQGKLPPAQIEARAERWGVKLFLSHWHEAAYFLEHGVAAPYPYVIQQLGHIDYIAVPNTGLVPGLEAALAIRRLNQLK